MNDATMTQTRMTIGIDLGDTSHQVCVLDGDGKAVQERQITNTYHALGRQFARLAPALVAIEASTHSPWVSAALENWGHQVLVANPRKLRAISDSQHKTDRNDARLLAKLARVDPELLSPIRHRGAQTQADLALIKARHALVRARTSLINQCRGMTKSIGERLPTCSAESFHKLADAVPPVLRPALEPLMQAIGETTEKIRQLERRIEKLAREKYPDCAQLSQPIGVGMLTAMCYLLVIEDPRRFKRSRQVGAYIGLAPGNDQSGQSDKQLRITKAGDRYLRMLLVQCAQYVLSRRSRDCELKRWGLELAERGGKAAKKRAVIAVARRLATQMHRLWISGEPYDPFHAEKRRQRAERGGEEFCLVDTRQDAGVLGRVKDKPPAAVRLTPHP